MASTRGESYGPRSMAREPKRPGWWIAAGATLGLVVLVAVARVWVLGSGRAGSGSLPSSEPGAEARAGSDAPLAVGASRALAPTAQPSPRAGAPTPPQHEASGPGPLVAGRVIDLGREAVPGAFLHPARDPGEIWGSSDGDGRFVLLVPEGSDCIAARKEGFATVLGCCPAGSADVEHVIVVAPVVDVAGVVVDEQDQPVADARLWMRIVPERLTSVGAGLETNRLASAWTSSDAMGAFAFAGLVTGEGIRLGVQKEGFQELDVAIPAVDTEGWVLRLRRWEDSLLVTGRVVHSDGRPAASAMVEYGEWSRTTTDAEGAFQLSLVDFDEEGELVATLPGFRHAALRGFLPPEGERGGALADLVLVLGPPALAISGHVHEADGAGAAGWRVSILEGTPTTFHALSPRFAEERSGACAVGCPTDAAGAFELSGLSERSYVLSAHDPASGRLVLSEPIPAGARGVVLQARATCPELRGIVRSRAGLPLAGVQVKARCNAVVEGGSFLAEGGPTASTGADGRFVLRDVPTEHLVLVVEGPGILPTWIPASAADVLQGEQAELELTVQATCPFVLESEVPAGVAGLGFRTESGEPTLILLPGGFSAVVASLPDQLHASLAVSEDATELVLLGPGGEELGSRRVALSPLERTRIALP